MISLHVVLRTSGRAHCMSFMITVVKLILILCSFYVVRFACLILVDASMQ